MTLFTNHGTGDTYMTLAFAHHVGRPVVYGNPAHAAIAAMFPDVPSSQGTVGEVALHIHPEAAPPVGISRYALLGRPVTHADLWRGLLQLPLDAEMRRGQFKCDYHPEEREVLLVTQARSWPNSHPEFWDHLEGRLRAQYWNVYRNDPTWSLQKLFDECWMHRWVIGPQCGVMSILCHAGFPCRKTFATPSVDGHPYYKRTFPYASVRTFAGEDYDDVEEVKITSDLGRAVDEVMSGRHARRLPVRRNQVHGVQITLTHGDFFDRLSILEIKSKMLAGDKRAMIMRDYLHHREVADPIVLANPHVLPLYAKLLCCNAEAWTHNETSVTGMLQNGTELSEHFAIAARHNKDRIAIKNQISALLSSAHVEVKSYYEEGTR